MSTTFPHCWLFHYIALKKTDISTSSLFWFKNLEWAVIYYFGYRWSSIARYKQISKRFLTVCIILCHDTQAHDRKIWIHNLQVSWKICYKKDPFKTNTTKHQNLHQCIYNLWIFFWENMCFNCNLMLTTNTFQSCSTNIILDRPHNYSK